jgi:uroporphyrinogen-III synthase
MARGVDAILLYSAEAARRLARLAVRKDVRRALDDAVAVCLSGDVADALGPDWPGRRIVATAPTETALLASLAALR